jgi:hypothetical protein
MRTLLTFTLLLLALTGLLLVSGVDAHRQVAVAALSTPIAAPTPGVTAPCPDEGVASLADCPLTGCGENGDAELNRAKNKTEIPSVAAVRPISIDDIKAIDQPNRWDTGQDRSSIRGAGKEGTPVRLTGYLLVAKHEGAESCNCELTRRADTDVHLVIVSDLEEPEEDSVTVEITPRVRNNGHSPAWLWRNVRDNLENEYIRVTGWLMLDTKHIPQAHRLPGERQNKNLKRATNWEVHPITKIERCTSSVTACDHGHGWVVY